MSNEADTADGIYEDDFDILPANQIPPQPVPYHQQVDKDTNKSQHQNHTKYSKKGSKKHQKHHKNIFNTSNTPQPIKPSYSDTPSLNQPASNDDTDDHTTSHQCKHAISYYDYRLLKLCYTHWYHLYLHLSDQKTLLHTSEHRKLNIKKLVDTLKHQAYSKANHNQDENQDDDNHVVGKRVGNKSGQGKNRVSLKGHGNDVASSTTLPSTISNSSTSLKASPSLKRASSSSSSEPHTHPLATPNSTNAATNLSHSGSEQPPVATAGHHDVPTSTSSSSTPLSTIRPSHHKKPSITKASSTLTHTQRIAFKKQREKELQLKEQQKHELQMLQERQKQQELEKQEKLIDHTSYQLAILHSQRQSMIYRGWLPWCKYIRIQHLKHHSAIRYSNWKLQKHTMKQWYQYTKHQKTLKLQHQDQQLNDAVTHYHHTLLYSVLRGWYTMSYTPPQQLRQAVEHSNRLIQAHIFHVYYQQTLLQQKQRQQQYHQLLHTFHTVTQRFTLRRYWYLWCIILQEQYESKRLNTYKEKQWKKVNEWLGEWRVEKTQRQQHEFTNRLMKEFQSNSHTTSTTDTLSHRSGESDTPLSTSHRSNSSNSASIRLPRRPLLSSTSKLLERSLNDMTPPNGMKYTDISSSLSHRPPPSVTLDDFKDFTTSSTGRHSTANASDAINHDGAVDNHLSSSMIHSLPPSARPRKQIPMPTLKLDDIIK